jgi:TP901 family phage tail tape measure protein
MNNNLKILITSSLNVGRSIGEINSAIAGLEKKINKLKLKIEVPENFNTHIQSFIKATEKLKSVADEQNKVISETQDIYNKLDGTVTQVSQKVLKSGEIIQKTKTIHDDNKKSMQDETLAADKLAKAVDRLNNSELDSITVLKNKANATKGYRVVSSEGSTVTTRKLESDGQTLIGSSTTTNFKKDREDEQKLLEQMYAGRIKSEERVRNESRKWNEEQQRAIQKNMDMDRAATEKKLRDLETYRAKYIASITDLERRYGNKVNTGALSSLKTELGNMDIGNPDFDKRLREIPNQIKQIGAEAKIASAHTLTMGEALKTALTRFPIWMVAATAFYAPLRALNSAVDTIIQIDKQLTELRRVVDPVVDVNDMLRVSINLANELGQSIQNVNQAMIGFARQGNFSEQQIEALTRTAIMAANISELSVEESMSTMVSAMEVFNIKAEDSIRIINAINEVDNQFAITSRDLALALQKAGSAGDAFGVTMEEQIGHVTAIGVQTRESGAVVGNALKTIYSRLTTMRPAIDSLASIGINVRDSNGEMKTATQIITELQSSWSNLNAETQQSLGVALAGRYQLNRFFALMSGGKLSVDATTTALNSFGSAARENDKYQQGLEARINKMKNAFSELALTVGDAVLTDSLILLIKGATDLAKIGSELTSNFGILGPVMGTVGVATLALNSNFRNFVASLLVVEAGTTRATIATRALTVSLRTLASATLVGAAFVALGFIFEKIIKNSADATRNISDLDNALNDNQDEVFKLTDKYHELKKIIEENTKSDIEIKNAKTELTKVIEALANKMPSLVTQWNEHGKAVDINITKLDDYKKKYGEVLRIAEQTKIDQGNKRKQELEKRIASNNELLEPISGLFDFGRVLQGAKGILSNDFKYKREDIANEILKDGQEIAKIEQEIKKSQELLDSLNNTDKGETSPEKKSGTLGKVKSPEDIEEEYKVRKDVFQSEMEQFRHLVNMESAGYENAAQQLEQLKKIRNSFSDLYSEDLYGIDEDIFRLQKGDRIDPKGYKEPKQDTQATLTTLPDFTKEEIDNINSIISKRDQNIKSLERQINTEKKTDDYNKTLELTNKLLTEQQSKIEDIYSANKNLSGYADEIRGTYTELAELFAMDNGEGTLVGFDAWFNDDATASKAYTNAITDIVKQVQQIEGTGENLTTDQENQIKVLKNQKSQYESIFGQIQSIKQAWKSNDEEVQQVIDRVGNLLTQIDQLAKEHRENEFKLSENWISEETTRLTLAGKTEIEIAQMVLDARLRMADSRWTKERGIIALSESEQLIADKNVYDARMKLLELSEQKNKKLEEIAKKVVDAHRKSLEYQRDEQLKDLEKIAEQQEKNHNDKMTQLDDELQKYKNSVDEQLSLLDKLNEKEDFDSELSKKQSDAQKIQSQINVLALDDSIETKAKREQLEKELQAKLEEIEKFKEDRSRKLRRDSLQEQLNQKEKEIEASKKAEDTKYEGIKNGLKNVEDARKVYWENVLNNDAYFAQLESEIIAGNISTIENSLNGLKNEISSNTSEMGKSIRNNLVAELENALRLLQAVSLGNVSNVVVDSALAQKRSDHSKYIQNKVEWESLSKSAKPNLERMTQLNIENEAFRKKYGFADYDYQDIIKGNVARFDTGGMTPAFGKEPQLAFLDEKELILDKFDTSKLLKVVDVTRSIFESIRKPNFNNIRFNRTEPVATGPTYNLNLRIDQVTGDRNGGETVFNTIVKNFQKMGN